MTDSDMLAMAARFDRLAQTYAKSSDHEAWEVNSAWYRGDENAARDHEEIANVQGGRALGMMLAARMVRAAVKAKGSREAA